MIVFDIDLIPQVPKAEYTPSGILPSEMAIFNALCKAKCIDMVVESGRHYGYSTRCLAENRKLRVISYDHKPIPEVDAKLNFFNVQIRTGDSNIYLPRAVAEHSIGSRLAVLIDGPKNKVAWALGTQLSSDVVFWAVHDVFEGSFLQKALKDRYGQKVYFTCESQLPNYLALADEPAWINTYESRAEATRPQFGLAIIQGDMWDV